MTTDKLTPEVIARLRELRESPAVSRRRFCQTLQEQCTTGSAGTATFRSTSPSTASSSGSVRGCGNCEVRRE